MVLPPNLYRLMIMAALPLVLWLWPVKVQPRTLLLLAFSFWMAGGLVLCLQGFSFVQYTHPTPATIALPLAVAAVIGIAKGRFILSKTSARNIERIRQLTQPQKPIAVYSLRSWIVIGLMLLISVMMFVLHVDLFWRGIINIGIGLGLVVSSLVYQRAIISSQALPQG